nr:immunoglobulin heavy chain junction region [Macaca mulatta]MOW77645.1 immunoglobulin heavy chain junction region [Macaca mulatta]
CAKPHDFGSDRFDVW